MPCSAKVFFTYLSHTDQPCHLFSLSAPSNAVQSNSIHIPMTQARLPYPLRAQHHDLGLQRLSHMPISCLCISLSSGLQMVHTGKISAFNPLDSFVSFLPSFLRPASKKGRDLLSFFLLVQTIQNTTRAKDQQATPNSASRIKVMRET